MYKMTLHDALVFLSVWLTLYTVLSIISKFISGRKMGLRIILKGILGSLLFGCSYGGVFLVMFVLVPILPDLWKIAGGCGSMVFLIPLVGLEISIMESRKNDRIDKLKEFGWKSLSMEDFKDLDEWDKHRYELYHPEHGMKELNKAEEIVYGKWTF